MTGAFSSRVPRVVHIGLVCLAATTIPAFATEQAKCPPAAVQQTPEAAQSAMQNASDHGFLWRISKGGHASYLYGTIHVAKREWAFPGPDVKQALSATDTLALELDVLDPEVQKHLAAAVARAPATVLPASLTKRIEHQAQELCVPYESIAKLTPELQLMSLEMSIGRRDGLEPGYATDEILAALGHRAKKTVVSLETPEFQIGLLKMGNAKETVDGVGTELQELENGQTRALLQRVAKAWENSDYAELADYRSWCDCLRTDGERALMKRLLDDRNPKLAERIDALHMSGKQVFAAVGSLHMIGPAGLPALMAQRGYTVEKLLPAASGQTF